MDNTIDFNWTKKKFIYNKFKIVSSLVIPQYIFSSKRAAWRWSRDRSAIASRWSWLLAQISDLEYRIRQHNELHMQIRKNKGDVCFEQDEPPSQQSVNGYRGLLPGNTKPLNAETSTDGDCDTNSGSAARTRAFQRNGFRKRKLLQTVNLHTISKKAARPRYVYLFILLVTIN